MNKRRAALWFAVAILGASPQAAFAEDGFYKSNIRCVGPVMQPQLQMLPNSIDVAIVWDSLFNNSNVYFRILNFSGQAASRIMRSRGELRQDPPIVAYMGSFVSNDVVYGIRLDYTKREGLPYVMAHLTVGGKFYYLKCNKRP